MTQSSAASQMVPGEFSITQLIDAPVEAVYRAWTEPEHITHWFGPHMFSTPLDTISVDARPGGLMRMQMVFDLDGSVHPVEKVFSEVVESEKLVFSWGDLSAPAEPAGAGTATVTFVDTGDGTEMTFAPTGLNTADGHLNARGGWSESFERFTEYVERTAGDYAA